MIQKNKKRCVVIFSENGKYARIDEIIYVRSWRKQITPAREVELEDRRSQYMKKYRMKCAARLKRLEEIERQFEKQFHSDIAETIHPESYHPENVPV